jgi:GPH family glycoside/pentoside/hexuronide:cation symporter
MSSHGAKLPLSLKSAHGLGAVAMGVKETGLTTFFMLYYNQVLGYDPRVISLVLIVAMFADAIADPWIGRLSDATRSRWGRRLPWLYAAALPMAISWAFLWLDRGTETQSIIWLAINVIAVRLFVSGCEIPSVSLVAELTQDYDERTALTRFRFLFGWTGGLVTTALAYGYFLASDVPGQNGLLNAAGYESFGWFGAGVIILSTIASAWGQHKRVVALPEQKLLTEHHSIFADLRRAFRNPSFRALAIAALFIVAAYATSISAINYMMLYVWQLTDQQITYYPLGLGVAVLAAFLLIQPLHLRFGKRDTAIVAALVSAALNFLTYAARNVGIWPELGSNVSALLLLLCVTAALLGQILTTISASSMIAEIVEDHEATHDERREGLFYSSYFMIQKIGSALGIFLVGQMIVFAGLEGQISPANLPESVALGMSWAYVATITLLTIGMALSLRHYSIDRVSHEARLAEIAARKAALHTLIIAE